MHQRQDSANARTETVICARSPGVDLAVALLVGTVEVLEHGGNQMPNLSYVTSEDGEGGFRV